MMKSLELVEMEVGFSSQYDFWPFTPQGFPWFGFESAGRRSWGEKIIELAGYKILIPKPKAIDKPFLPPIEDLFSISGGSRCYRS
ncbi:hypothetical protein IMY97_22335 [Pectobacterium versatile]|nr:hypothetical protein [Pectobacterium versatile]UNE79048.1 hypothetical protein IMY97_22335 [Pectobacterium versatile]